MTRGQIAVFHSEGITTSTEFNGDMYFPDGKWAGHGQQVVDALKDIKTVDDYKQFVKAFNDEHFQYCYHENSNYRRGDGKQKR